MSASEIIIVIVVVLVWLGLISLVLRGWRNRGRRQAELIGEMPVAPTEPVSYTHLTLPTIYSV